MDKFSDPNLENITKIAEYIYRFQHKKDGGLYDFIYDKTLKYWKRWDGSGSRFGYIKYMVSLEILNYYKTRSCKLIPRPTCYQPDNTLEIMDSLGTLNKNERIIIYNKFWNNYSFKEMATKYKIHVNTIYNYYKSGINKLRKIYVF